MFGFTWCRFGYADFYSQEEFEKALELSGSSIDGREVRVDKAGQRSVGQSGGRGRDTPRTPRGGGGRGRAKSEPSSCLICIGLSYDTDSESLKGAFPGCVGARVITERETGNSRG